MTKPQQVDPHYLQDIQGKLPFPSLDTLLAEVGLKNLVPESVAKHIDDLAIDEAVGIHQYLCNLDRDAHQGNQQKCATGKALSNYDRQLSRPASYGWIEDIKTGTIVYFGTGKDRRPKLPANRIRTGQKIQGSRLGLTVGNQRNLARQRRKLTHYTQSVNPNRISDKSSNFAAAVNGEAGKSIGQRAVLFDANGNVLRGTNAIRDESIATELSSHTPTKSINSGTIPDKIKPAKAINTSRHPNKKGIGQTNDLIGGVAALGGIAGLAAVIAMLMPMHFVTSAITFLTSITTFFTNVNNAVNTFLSVSEALLGIFGIKNSTKGIKSFIAGIVDNAFGKKNVQLVKNAFASGINSIAVSTKVLEKISAFRAGTNNKVDELALQLGVVNNALGDAGLIPPEYMATSKAIDDFETARAKDAPELTDNITQLTKELETQTEAKKALKDEAEIVAKDKAVKDKQITDVKNLASAAKSNVDKINADRI